MSIDFRELARQQFEFRWHTYLSGCGRMDLAAEAFEDCEIKRHGEHYFNDVECMSYEDMCDRFSGYGDVLLQEIHDRLAGSRRRSGKNSSRNTERLLVFAPPDNFSSND